MLQEQFLRALVEGHVPVTIYLVNGIKLVGDIDFYDQYGLLLRGNSQFIYKHAISTILPSRDGVHATRSNEDNCRDGTSRDHNTQSRKLRPP